MPPEYDGAAGGSGTPGVVRATCPQCGALAKFQRAGVRAGAVSCPPHQRPRPLEQNGASYTVYDVLMECGGCGRGGLATVLTQKTIETGHLGDFYPKASSRAPLPVAVPNGILSDFREAEDCAAIGAYRAASGLFRSVLEKTLKANGYVKGNLKDKIDLAATDGVITASRKRNAHENIRALGNDVLHDEWREVTADEVETCHRYAQRLLEDFYDLRADVLDTLYDKGRLPRPETP